MRYDAADETLRWRTAVRGWLAATRHEAATFFCHAAATYANATRQYDEIFAAIDTACCLRRRHITATQIDSHYAT